MSSCRPRWRLDKATFERSPGLVTRRWLYLHRPRRLCLSVVLLPPRLARSARPGHECGFEAINATRTCHSPAMYPSGQTCQGGQISGATIFQFPHFLAPLRFTAVKCGGGRTHIHAPILVTTKNCVWTFFLVHMKVSVVRGREREGESQWATSAYMRLQKKNSAETLKTDYM